MRGRVAAFCPMFSVQHLTSDWPTITLNSAQEKAVCRSQWWGLVAWAAIWRNGCCETVTTWSHSTHIAMKAVTVPAEYLASLPDDTPAKFEIGALGAGDNATFTEAVGICVNEDEGCSED